MLSESASLWLPHPTAGVAGVAPSTLRLPVHCPLSESHPHGADVSSVVVPSAEYEKDFVCGDYISHKVLIDLSLLH